MRIGDILKKSHGDPEKAKQLALNMAKAITNRDKAKRRAEAAEKLFDFHKEGVFKKVLTALAEIFWNRYEQLGGRATARSMASRSSVRSASDDLKGETPKGEALKGEALYDAIVKIVDMEKDGLINGIEVSVSDALAIQEVADRMNSANMNKFLSKPIKKIIDISKKAVEGEVKGGRQFKDKAELQSAVDTLADNITKQAKIIKIIGKEVEDEVSRGFVRIHVIFETVLLDDPFISKENSISVNDNFIKEVKKQCKNIFNMEPSFNNTGSSFWIIYSYKQE